MLRYIPTGNVALHSHCECLCYIHSGNVALHSQWECLRYIHSGNVALHSQWECLRYILNVKLRRHQVAKTAIDFISRISVVYFPPLVYKDEIKGVKNVTTMLRTEQ